MKEFDKLIEIVERLRNPKDGCPWDRKQTHKSLIPNFIEELYEAVEAIENNDLQHLSEELGDLLLHIVMQTQIAVEKAEFDMQKVISKINRKLVNRHPHIFGNHQVTDAAQVKKNWEQIKQKEKRHVRKSILDGIPKIMPALIIAQRIQEKAASVGFDWDDLAPAVAKVKEEFNEFEESYKKHDKKEMESELGDIIFAVVNIARKSEIDAESALKKTIKKFRNRFQQIEKYHKDKDLDIKESSLEELDEIWEASKKNKS